MPCFADETESVLLDGTYDLVDKNVYSYKSLTFCVLCFFFFVGFCLVIMQVNEGIFQHIGSC